VTITNDLRRIIETCGLTRYAIAQRTGISEGTLSKFMAGADVTTRTIDKLAVLLNLRIVHGKAKRSDRGRITKREK